MTLCGLCLTRPTHDQTRFRYAPCDQCGTRTECAVLDPPSVTPPPRPRPPLTLRQRLAHAVLA